jgi:hypothetical protein
LPESLIKEFGVKFMTRFNHFLYGFIPGLILPIAFMWVYLNKFYPVELPFLEMLKQMYPSILLGKILMLSVMPNLALVFAFYKSDSFKIATGMMISAMPYFIGSILML